MTALPDRELEAVQYAAELIRQSRCTVVLTGAGISTPSGIPDFRSEGTGLWAKTDPMDVASLNTFRCQPERFFDWMRPLVEMIVRAEPNPAHRSLAQLEAGGYVKTVITPHIDTLHQKAGSRNVLETHGTVGSMSCTACFSRQPAEDYLEPFLTQGRMPRCKDCGGILKPDVILFGEQLPQETWSQALRASRSCDLMLVAGSSLEVLPVAGLPMQALDHGAHLVIVNQSPTYLGVRADVVILDDVALILPAIAAEALRE